MDVEKHHDATTDPQDGLMRCNRVSPSLGAQLTSTYSEEQPKRWLEVYRYFHLVGLLAATYLYLAGPPSCIDLRVQAFDSPLLFLTSLFLIGFDAPRAWRIFPALRSATPLAGFHERLLDAPVIVGAWTAILGGQVVRPALAEALRGASPGSDALASLASLAAVAVILPYKRLRDSTETLPNYSSI